MRAPGDKAMAMHPGSVLLWKFELHFKLDVIRQRIQRRPV